MYMEFLFGDLNPNSYPHTPSTYTCRMTTAPRLHGGHIVLNGLALFGYIFGLLVSFHNINFFFLETS